MTSAAATMFRKHPHSRAAIAVRRWDDEAKDPKAATPDVGHFQRVLQRIAVHGLWT
jgi:gamma-butyrobetaine dioxygenase